MKSAVDPSVRHWIIQAEIAVVEGRLQQVGQRRQGKTRDDVRSECQGQNTVVSRGKIRSIVRG